METCPKPRIAIIGAGLMGHGIAQEFAAHGHCVSLYDVSEAVLEQARQRITTNLERLAVVGIFPSDAAEPALSRIDFRNSLEEAVAEADLVIEAVSENLPLKQDLFGRLDRFCPPETILASNTSSFMPSLLAPATQRPDKVLIAHYFNPPYLLPLVEVVPSPQTSEATIQAVMSLLAGIGKTPVLLKKETPGFVGNRLQAALIREAFAIVSEGIATPTEVDSVVRYGFGRRLAAAGPFEIGDAAGWDIWRAIAGQLLTVISSHTEVPDLLEERVAKGELGLKSGKGFYDWSDDGGDALRARIAATLLQLSQNDTSTKV